ncbi:MAG: class I SAM-dependent methyltransferase [Actinomycetes bacterium]
MGELTRADLEGVPETLLWNLYQRSTEARRPDAVLADPKAVAVVDAIDYPFAERFGDGGMGQWQALRARCFDQQVERFLAAHPDGTVVALGEGLETQFWRVDNGAVRWLTVELPETLRLRHEVLPADSKRQQTIACSALEQTWMERVEPSRGLLLTAQGLLMYFQPAQVHRLLTTCADRFPGSALVFDGVPPWFSARTLRGQMKTRQGYQTPPMPWAVDGAEMDRIRALHPDIAELRLLDPPRGRGLLYGGLFPLLNRVAAVRLLGVTGLPIMRVQFGPDR